jgi:hypothetical protein
MRGGAVADTAFPLNSKAGASTDEWGSGFSPWCPLAEVHASVKRRGAARRRGRRRRRGAGEAEDEGVCGDPVWLLPHGRLRLGEDDAPTDGSPPPSPPLQP